MIFNLITDYYKSVPPYWRFENLSNLEIFRNKKLKLIDGNKIDLEPTIFHLQDFNFGDIFENIEIPIDLPKSNIKVSLKEIDDEQIHRTYDRISTEVNDCFFKLSELSYNPNLQNFFGGNDYWLYIFCTLKPNLNDDYIELEKLNFPIYGYYNPVLDDYVCDYLIELEKSNIEPFFEFHYQNYRGNYLDFLIHTLTLKIWSLNDLPETQTKKIIFKNWIKTKFLEQKLENEIIIKFIEEQYREKIENDFWGESHQENLLNSIEYFLDFKPQRTKDNSNPYPFIQIKFNKNRAAESGTTQKLYIFFKYVDEDVLKKDNNYLVKEWFGINAERFQKTVLDIELNKIIIKNDDKYKIYAKKITDWIKATKDEEIIKKFNSDFPD